MSQNERQYPTMTVVATNLELGQVQVINNVTSIVSLYSDYGYKLSMHSDDPSEYPSKILDSDWSLTVVHDKNS